MRPTPLIAATLVALLSVPAFPQANQSSAPTPPMGWNSWDSYGTTVREDQVKANADAMARDLLIHGWKYIVIYITCH
jgi:hypothetical protein